MSAASPRLNMRKSIGNPRAAASCAAAATGVPFASPSESTISRPGRSRGIRLAARPIAPPEIAAVAIDLLHERAGLAELLRQPLDARLASVRDDPDPVARRASLLEQLDDLERARAAVGGHRAGEIGDDDDVDAFAAERRQRHRREQRQERRG